MQIRVYYPYFPYPFTEAAYQVVFNQCHDLYDMGHEVELVVWKDSKEEIQTKLLQKEFMYWNSKISIVSLKVSNKNESKLTRVAQSLLSPYASPELFHYPPKLMPSDIRPVDLEIYHYTFSYPWLKNLQKKPQTKTVVQFHNLEHELFQERAQRSGPIEKWIHRRNVKKLYQHESELSKIADEVWQISPVDFERYKRQIGGSSAATMRLVSPTMRPELREFRKKEWIKSKASIDSKLRLGFIGSLTHGPNASSATWILKEICPRLKAQNFQGEILFVGHPGPTNIKEMATPFPFVKFLGFLDNVETFWSQISYLLVPHILGSGMRVKILDSLMSGVPVICNQAAARRLHPELHSTAGLFISDIAEQWCEHILSKQNFEDRSQLLQEPIPKGMSKELIYEFL